MSGSKVVCTYPKLIAAYHVLLRLLEPRHPPFALSFFFYVWNCCRQLIEIFQNREIVPKNYLHCELNCFLICSWTTNWYLRINCYCFYIRQYVKDRLCFSQWRESDSTRLHSLYPSTKWRITDSNRWPPACKAGALASWANPPQGSPAQSWTADLHIISVAL